MMAVFQKAFRDSRRSILWFSIGLGAYTLLILSFYPTIVNQADQLNDLMRNLPAELLSVVTGGLDMAEVDIADLGAYLQGRLMSWVILALGVMVTGQAFNALTNAERDGTMDVMMSFPITRAQMLLGRFLNTAVSLLIILTCLWVVLALAARAIPEVQASISSLGVMVYSVFFLVILQAALAYMLAALVPSIRRWVGAVAYTLFFGSYLIFGLGPFMDFFDQIRPLLMFNYYNAAELINAGVNLGHVLTLSAAALVFLAVSLWRFERKPLGV